MDKNETVDVAIIGAGMSGLSAAVHARLAGLSVMVFEQLFFTRRQLYRLEKVGLCFRLLHRLLHG